MKTKSKNDILITKCESYLVEISEKDASAISGGLFPWGGNLFAYRQPTGYLPDGRAYYSS